VEGSFSYRIPASTFWRASVWSETLAPGSGLGHKLHQSAALSGRRHRASVALLIDDGVDEFGLERLFKVATSTVNLDVATVAWIAKAYKEMRRLAMEVTLPPDLRKQLEEELASGRYKSPDELIGQAIRHFLDERQRGQRRLDAPRRIGQAVDQAGLYERVLILDEK